MQQLKPLILLGAALVLPVAALTVLSPSPPACRLQVIPDYVTPIAFKAVLRLSPGCPAGTVLRVRKSSTMSTRRDGARYQPIKPGTGAWEVGNTYASVKWPVPDDERWTTKIPASKAWQWEWFDPERYNPLTKKSGLWVAGEVLRAAP